jgi:hypothetical protein
MMLEQLLDKLKPEVAGLHALLSDPHPGLMTWGMMVCRRWQAIAELWEPTVPKDGAGGSRTASPEAKKK